MQRSATMGINGNILVALAAVVVVLGSAYGGLPLLLLACFILLVLVATLVPPEKAVLASIVYLPLDWLIVLSLDRVGVAEGRFLRDAFIVFVFLSWYFDSGRLSWQEVALRMHPPIQVAIFVVCGVSLAYAIPVLSEPAVAVLGVRARLLPMLMIPVGIDLVRRSGFLRRLIWWSIAILVVSGIVITIQVFRGDTLAPALGLSYPLLGVGSSGENVYRFPGPFLGPGLPWVLVASSVLLLSLWSSREISIPAPVSVAAGVSWIVCLFANNQRSVMIYVPIAFICLLVFAPIGHRLVKVATGSVLLMIPAFALAGDALLSRASTLVNNPYDVYIYQRVVFPWETKIWPTLQEFPFGRGIGFYSNATRFLQESPNQGTTLESFVAVTIGEVGIIGMASWALLLVLIIKYFVRMMAENRGAPSYIRTFWTMLIAVYVFIVLLSITYEPLAIYPFPQLLWLLTGMGFGFSAYRNFGRGEEF